MNNCVSIIIPIFNPGEALSKCVESVLAQSFVDIEVILINDGSTDNSDCICRKFAAVDKRIKYFPQENAGVSAARNKGIAMASGKYLCFVDSDDFVDPGYVCSMVEAIEISGADIVIQGLKQLRNGALINWSYSMMAHSQCHRYQTSFLTLCFISAAHTASCSNHRL